MMLNVLIRISVRREAEAAAVLDDWVRLRPDIQTAVFAVVNAQLMTGHEHHAALAALQIGRCGARSQQQNTVGQLLQANRSQRRRAPLVTNEKMR